MAGVSARGAPAISTRHNDPMTTRTVDIDAAISAYEASPADRGSVELIAVRPADGERKVVESASLMVESGVDGDNWLERAAAKGEVSYHAQVTLMNSRFAAAVTPEGEGWEIAGDQFYVDFDISHDNAPAGSRFQIGTATVEISEEPHTGCAKFSKRFGREVLRSTMTDKGKRLRLRGVNARVIESGVVTRGDAISGVA